MATTKDALGHTVRITGIASTSNYDMRQNVKKRLNTIRFNQSIPDTDINLAYASADEVYVDTNLFISDKSTSVSENSPGFLIEEQSFTGPSYTSFFKNFLLTDVFTPVLTTRPAAPLYFRHTLDKNIDENSIKILDKNFNPISGYNYIIQKPYTYSLVDGLPNDGSDIDHPLDYEAIYVYNNLENSVDFETGDYVIYYIGYADITTGNAVNELLNNTEVFHQVDFDDIWSVTSQMKPWVKAYQISEISGAYALTLPQGITYSIKTLDAARIFVEQPIDKASTDPWFVRVTNGSFKSEYNAESYIYNLPEFYNQNFNPIAPYKIVINEDSIRVTDHLILLKRSNLKTNPTLGFNMDIVISDASDNVLFAITNDPEKIGTQMLNDIGLLTDIIWDGEAIDSIDAKNGFVYLSTIIKDTYQISSTYYFEEKLYAFTTINFNPTQNTNIISERIVLYLVPENANNNDNVAHTGALHLLKVAPDGLITYTSQSGNDGNENLKTGFDYMIESAQRHSTTPGGLAHVFWVNTPAIPMGMYYDKMAYMGADTFIDTFTVSAAAGKPGLDKRYIVLAELFVNEHTSPDKVKLLDTRVRGGGIKESMIDKALLKNPEVQWYNDIGTFDGRPFPGTSVIIVKIPYTVLDEFGGLLSRKQVRQIVKKHMALGSEPIIRYYGTVPNITSIKPGYEKFTIFWDSEGSSYGYNIYYSNSENGPFIKYNTSLITDNALGNYYTMTGLANQIRYWITISAVNIYTNIEGPRAIPWISRPEEIFRLGQLGHTVTVTI